ncbi:uncharacterized protein [Macrobrachium rosenbergii]|uniref:uncharacterized protein n=1 Tax=Macrobrachium rosenbergii TaxID=79674 RepID=UPI0034D4ED89
MTRVWKVSLYMFLLFATTFAIEKKVLDSTDETTQIPKSAVITSTPKKCERECEIRLKDGECRISITCLMEKLYRRSEHERPSLEKGGKCKGKCLFTDTEDNCRLDLICVLDKDIEGTLRFLMDFDIDAESTILLALAASTNGKEGLCNENVDTPPEGHCLRPEGKPTGSEEDPQGEGADKGFFPKPDISSPPTKICPGKCQVRDRSGRCVVDYDCVNNAQ